MIRLSVFYPASEGARFDHDYHRELHVPLAAKSWGLDSYEIDKGVDAMADMANSTDIRPVLQTSEIIER
jgi:uncharacterized protein (TIGR02118 family)